MCRNEKLSDKKYRRYSYFHAVLFRMLCLSASISYGYSCARGIKPIPNKNLVFEIFLLANEKLYERFLLLTFFDWKRWSKILLVKNTWITISLTQNFVCDVWRNWYLPLSATQAEYQESFVVIRFRENHKNLNLNF